MPQAVCASGTCSTPNRVWALSLGQAVGSTRGREARWALCLVLDREAREKRARRLRYTYHSKGSCRGVLVKSGGRGQLVARPRADLQDDFWAGTDGEAGVGVGHGAGLRHVVVPWQIQLQLFARCFRNRSAAVGCNPAGTRLLCVPHVDSVYGTYAVTTEACGLESKRSGGHQQACDYCRKRLQEGGLPGLL